MTGAAKGDSLYARYMKAFQASTAHTSGCPACQASAECAVGAPIHERFARLQDAYRRLQAEQKRF
ncbi:hypothetical protein AB0451_34500 [Streptomyces sp. NPDC052000]|uniref:hypothetical protein n=1 Tax=Streptomyces sp. NPDC052000 TaxID=3155676 RepID=UPI00344CD284